MTMTALTTQSGSQPSTSHIVLTAKHLHTHFLDACDAKVARLNGGSSEVVLGDPVPLVATVSFRFAPPHGGTDPVDPNDATPLKNLPTNGILFHIDETGKVQPTLSNVMIADDVTKWLDENYSFNFTIKTSTGRPLHASPDSILQRTSVKWMRVLETAGLQSDLVELDVHVEPTKSVRLEVHEPKDILKTTAEGVVLLEKAVHGLAQQIDTATANAKTVDADTQQKAADIQTKAADIQTRTVDIQARATDIQTKATDIQTKAADIQTKAADTQTKAADIQTRTVDIQARATDIQAKAKASNAVVETLPETLSALHEKLDRMDVKVTGLAVLQAKIDALEWSSIESLRSTLDSILHELQHIKGSRR